jgi:hypothetical protein
MKIHAQARPPEQTRALDNGCVVLVLVILTGSLHPLLATIASGVLAFMSRRFRKPPVVLAVAYAVIVLFFTAYRFANPPTTTFGP